MSTVTVTLGIDPGAQGALVLLIDGKPQFWAMPTATHKTSKGKARVRTSGEGLCVVLHAMRAAGVRTAFVEDVWGIKGQGAGSGAALGHAIGCIETACAAAGIAVRKVSAMRWKYDSGILKKGKAGAVALARELHPDCPLFVPKRGKLTAAQCEGYAEAALIARWGVTHGNP